MTSLQELKARSKSNLEKFKEKAKAPVYEKKSDERYWSPKRGDDGNGFAIIRFLPVSKVDDSHPEALPWVKIYSHNFNNKATGKYYAENSLTTFNEKDPVGELNSKLWEQDDAGKAQASRQKRDLKYTSNILVVKDPLNPENEGRVFLYKYGKKIYDKITALMNPDETYGEDPIDPFNFWTGRNFRMKIKTVKVDDKSFPNYDSSEWDSVAPISDKNGKPLSDDQIEAIWDAEYSLLELLDRSKHFKTYDELKKKLDEVLYGTTNSSATPSEKKVEPKKSEARPPVAQDDDEVNRLLEETESDSSDDTSALIDEWINE
jgi:hypothetical protein